MADRPVSTIRPYAPSDESGVRAIFGDDGFARPRLLRRYPRMGTYLADEVTTYYLCYEPESTWIAELGGRVVGALLGARDTLWQQEVYRRRVRPYLVQRCLCGAYGVPLWLWAWALTELASRGLVIPPVDLERYPAHLHIGILPAWRRQGIGSALMEAYAAYLRHCDAPGYHLYASSFHPLGVAFYRKLGLEELGQFEWRLHTGFEWLQVTETIFGRHLG